MKDNYFEIGLKGEIIAFEDFDEAVAFANENDVDLISEIGGSWDDFRKCWFCGEWVPESDLNKNDLCYHCESYLISRGEI